MTGMMDEDDFKPPCDSNCEHGGVCTLSAGHAGQHDSGYCQWSDAQAIPQEEADRIMRKQGYPQTLLDLESIARAAAKATKP